MSKYLTLQRPAAHVSILLECDDYEVNDETSRKVLLTHWLVFPGLGCREQFYGLSHSKKPMLISFDKSCSSLRKRAVHFSYVREGSAGLVLSVCSLLHWGKNSVWGELIIYKNI